MTRQRKAINETAGGSDLWASLAPARGAARAKALDDALGKLMSAGGKGKLRDWAFDIEYDDDDHPPSALHVLDEPWAA